MIKRKIYSIALLFILSILTVSQAAAFSRPVKRIKFPRGATAVKIVGSLNGYKDRQIYRIRVRAGQTIETGDARNDSSTHYITVFVNDPNGEGIGDGDASCGSHREVPTTVAGDYRIEVVECQKADAWRGNFKLSVKVK